MKIRSLTILVLVSLITLTLTANPVFAGGRHHERWKGIAIGLGAAIIGNAILNSNRDYSDRESGYCEVVVPPPPVYNHQYSGHWEVRDRWIPPTYKTVWNPAHYNRRGEWVNGAWIKIEASPGYWKEEKIWVAADTSSHPERY